ncbi:agmatinase family protein [Planctomycetota bacterium]|nr:agmatinase family protein [bacterium]MDB4736334.1 agmatinase family protein [Planctomycetota bacterium]
MDLDVNAASPMDSGLFGLPHGPGEARVHVLGVPFEATTSFRPGTSRAPEAILAASRQVDLFDLHFGRPYEQGIWIVPSDPQTGAWDREARSLAAPIIERGGAAESDLEAVTRVDAIGDAVRQAVAAFTRERLDQGRLPVILGGDHSTPLGAIEACAERYPGMGVLQFDAHADLRPAFEGFRWSHASVMHNVLEGPADVSSLLQVGVRDLCEQEYDVIQADPRVRTLFGHELAAARHGAGTRAMARAAVSSLPEHIFVSFDVDGLDPSLCPNTGTPVPGGLGWDEVTIWLEELAASDTHVVGLDLNEVSPGPTGDPGGCSWDAIVGARLLYRLIGAAQP